MSKFKYPKGRFSRREFMTTAGAGTAALLSPFTITSCRQNTPATAAYQPVSALDRPTAAVIGVGGRGRNMVMWGLSSYADLLAICDVDMRRAEPVADAYYKSTGRKIDIYQDYRELLDRQDIQLIGNATPEHWHTKINVDACRAGKDVYAEKPLTLTIDEGKILRRVVEETGRIIQVGTQQRSGLLFQVAVSLVHSGRIGKLKQIAVFMPGSNIEHGGPCTQEPIPEELNWEMWSGQAPLNPYCEARLERPSRWWDYGGGLVTNWGTHHMDIAHWGMGDKNAGPGTIEARGYCPNLGKPGYPDQFRPFVAKMEYPADIELWFMSTKPDMNSLNAETRNVVQGIYQDVPENISNYNVQDDDGGVLFIGDSGSIFVGRAGASGDGIGELDNIPIPERRIRWRTNVFNHTNDFINCVRTRRQPVSNVAEQVKSQLPCHLVNIALRVGRKLSWDADSEEFIDDSEANAYLKREQREPYRIKG